MIAINTGEPVLVYMFAQSFKSYDRGHIFEITQTDIYLHSISEIS